MNLSEELLDHIDGADESRGTDSRLTRWADHAQNLEDLISRAIDVCQRHIKPDGIHAAEAMNEMIGIFDGPQQRACFNPTSKAEPT